MLLSCKENVAASYLLIIFLTLFRCSLSISYWVFLLHIFEGNYFCGSYRIKSNDESEKALWHRAGIYALNGLNFRAINEKGFLFCCRARNQFSWKIHEHELENLRQPASDEHSLISSYWFLIWVNVNRDDQMKIKRIECDCGSLAATGRHCGHTIFVPYSKNLVLKAVSYYKEKP